MKLLGTLILVLAMMFSAERQCAHAFSTHIDHERPEHAMMDHGNGMDMDHKAPHGHHHQAPDETDPCPDDCDGGMDCAGCNALSSAIFSEASSGVFRPAAAAILSVAKTSVQPALALDPPVPKRRSLI